MSSSQTGTSERTETESENMEQLCKSLERCHSYDTSGCDAHAPCYEHLISNCAVAGRGGEVPVLDGPAVLTTSAATFLGGKHTTMTSQRATGGLVGANPSVFTVQNGAGYNGH